MFNFLLQITYPKITKIGDKKVLQALLGSNSAPGPLYLYTNSLRAYNQTFPGEGLFKINTTFLDLINLELGLKMTSGEGGELPEIVGLMNDSLVDQQAPLQLEGLPAACFSSE